MKTHLGIAFAFAFIPSVALADLQPAIPANTQLFTNGKSHSVPTSGSAFPPVALDGCSVKRGTWFGNDANGVPFIPSAYQTGPSYLGFEVGFVNVSSETATLVLVNVGGTDFVEAGTFTPGARFIRRYSAAPGPCTVKAVRFEDGTEWISQ
jgi:hypothetical protein